MQMYEDFQLYIHTYIHMSLCILICIPVAHSCTDMVRTMYKLAERRPTTAAAKKTEVLGIERRVVPPGTPVGVSVQQSSQYTCPICAQPIVEETDSIQGQEAILCEGPVIAGTTVGAQV